MLPWSRRLRLRSRLQAVVLVFALANYRHCYNIGVNTNYLDDRVTADLQSIDWLAVRDLPGILPTQQRRSQETSIALLEAAAVILRERSLDEFSIEDLCKRVGVTIGAFYGRFEGKDAFFNALKIGRAHV